MAVSYVLRDIGDSIPRAAAKLEGAAAATNELLPVMEKIALDMMRAMGAMWSSQGRRGGGSWKPLAFDTIRKKGHAVILVDSGMLRSSLTELDAPGQILNYTNSSVEFGTSIDYAEYQQYGAGHIPARPFLRFMDSDEARWQRWILEHILAGFAK